MELGVLAEGLGQCDSSDCDKVLDLRNTESETRSGLGSLLWVPVYVWGVKSSTNREIA